MEKDDGVEELMESIRDGWQTGDLEMIFFTAGEHHRNISDQLRQVGGQAGRQLAASWSRSLSAVLRAEPLLCEQHPLHPDQGRQDGGEGRHPHQGGRGGDHPVQRSQHRQCAEETGVPS